MQPNPDKKQLRQIMRERRAQAHAQNPNAPFALRDCFLKAITLPPKAIIAAYVAHDHEIDPAPLMNELHTRGYTLALPVVAGADHPLTFRTFVPSDKLEPGILKTFLEPLMGALAVEPDIILAPCLAFDRSGHRLGRGGGHYDRTLAELRKRRKILAIGLAFACQQLDKLPAESLDAKLDKIVTENEAIPILNSC